MSTLLIEKLSSIVSEIKFNKDEANVLSIFQTVVNDGSSQLCTFKSVMSSIDINFGKSASEIREAIESEKHKMLELKNKVDEFYNKVTEMNQNAIKRKEQCKHKLQESAIKKEELEFQIKQLETKIEENQNETKKVEDQVNELSPKINESKAEEKEVWGKLLKILGITVLTGAIAIPTGGLAVGAVGAVAATSTLGGFGVGITGMAINTGNSLEDHIKLLLQQAITLKESGLELLEKQSDLLKKRNEADHKLDAVKLECAEIEAKATVFNAILKVVCHLQIFVSKWQEPLDEIISIYVTHRQSSVESFVERDKGRLHDKLTTCLADLQSIYSDFKPLQVSFSVQTED